MIKLKNILLEQLNNVPAPAPGTYNLKFTVNYRDGNREPVNEKDVQVSEQDVQEFLKNKSLYNLSNEDFWKDISGELSNASPKLISGIKVESSSARKPEFEIYIDSVDIGNTTITSPNDTTTYDDFRNDIQDQLDDEGQNFVKAKVECRCRIGNTDYKFQFETDDPDTTVDNIYWDSDSFEQETGLNEQDILDKLTA
jgi:hypothetical protein